MQHNIEHCCGTTCDKKGNLEYVNQLEKEVDLLRHELAKSVGYIKRLCKGSLVANDCIRSAESVLSGIDFVRSIE